MLLRVLLFFIFLCAGTTHAAENGATPLETYWSQFRQAVLDGNSEKVASMTRFPLWVRGPDDSDPVMYYDKKSFPQIFTRLLNQEVLYLSAGEVRSKTMLQVVKDKKQIAASDYLTDTVINVGQFEFERIKGRWLFTRAYLEK